MDIVEGIDPGTKKRKGSFCAKVRLLAGFTAETGRKL